MAGRGGEGLASLSGRWNCCDRSELGDSGSDGSQQDYGPGSRGFGLYLN